jgi:hypothetical protein
MSSLVDYAGLSEYHKEFAEEQASIVGQADELLTINQIDRMKKLDSFIRESMRMSESKGNCLKHVSDQRMLLMQNPL